MQRIYERQLASHLYSGETSRGQAFVHLDDVVDAILRTVDRRAQLPAESVILIGEPHTMTYDELQHHFQCLIHGDSWETYNVPKKIAKAGAWVEDHIPGQNPFIKPWMIDRANDHYALDIARAGSLLDWVPTRSLNETLPKMVQALMADPPGWYREQKLEPIPPDATAAQTAASKANLQAHAHAPLDQASDTPGAHPDGYTCPMHPEVVRSAPGTCPKCGMALVAGRVAVARHES
jgi:hypothetical protein